MNKLLDTIEALVGILESSDNDSILEILNVILEDFPEQCQDFM